MQIPRLARRAIARLVQAEACESNPHYLDDLRIARLTVRYAATGEAVLCSPNVLASYTVLGLHPEKVWPAILARRESLGGSMLQVSEAPPKKPAQAVKLWSEKTNGARAVNSRAGEALVLCDQTISVPMAAPSIAAGYPNPDAPSSGKKGEYSYDELIEIVERSGAPEHVRNLTLAALIIRGRWPKKQGPVSPVITVSVKSIQAKSGVYRSTVQRRIHRAKQDRYWRELRSPNSWLDCPKCGAKRESAQCPSETCKHKGNGFNPNEFRRTYTYAIDIEKFANTPPCRQVREIRLKKGELREMPRQDAEAKPEVKPEERVRQTVEHQKARTIVNTQITADATVAAQRVFEFCGLADIGAIAQIAISIAAESKFRGIAIEAAAKHIAESAIQQQKSGITINRFWFRDLKWRTNGGQRPSPSDERFEQNRRNIAQAIYKNLGRGTAADGANGENDDGTGGDG